MPGVHPRDFVFGKDYSLMPASDSEQCGVVWASEYLIILRQAAGHREVASREVDVHSRWLTVYQMSSAPSKVAPGTIYEPLA